MNKIIKKVQFSEKVFLFEIEAPLIAKSRKAGNFVIVRVGENGERMPLTIADADIEKGTITIVVQEVGLSSTKLCNLNEGDFITDVVGPLVFQTGSDFRSDRVLNTTCENRRNASVVVFKGCATRYVSLGVCTPYHTTQTSVYVQIVSDWVTQFSSQLNALSFVCSVDVVAFVRHTT